MKRCWIHIGMHKTSSTSVQQNLKNLKRSTGSRLFTVGGRPNMGPALHAMFLADSGKCISLKKRGNSSEEIASKGEVWRGKLGEAIKNFEGRICIISGESLTDEVFGEDSVKSLRDFLTPLVDEIRVIGYVRPPCQYKNSRFQERIKHRLNKFQTERINYRAKFEKFDRVFGQSNVLLRKFDPANFPNHCAVADFCQQVGINLPNDMKIQRLNESLSRPACGILYAYRSFGPGFGKGRDAIIENEHLVRVLQKVGGRKLAFTATIMNAALISEKEDICWMEDRLGVSLAEQYSDTGGEVGSKEDLLMITQSSCGEFIRSFEETYQLCLMPGQYPQGDPVEPVDVAILLENCRGTIRQILSQVPQPSVNAPARPTSVWRLVSRRFRKIPRMLRRSLGKFFIGTF